MTVDSVTQNGLMENQVEAFKILYHCHFNWPLKHHILQLYSNNYHTCVSENLENATRLNAFVFLLKGKKGILPFTPNVFFTQSSHNFTSDQ